MTTKTPDWMNEMNNGSVTRGFASKPAEPAEKEPTPAPVSEQASSQDQQAYTLELNPNPIAPGSRLVTTVGRASRASSKTVYSYAIPADIAAVLDEAGGSKASAMTALMRFAIRELRERGESLTMRL